MSYKIVDMVFDLPDLKPSERLVMFVLARYEQDGKSFPGVPKVAKLLGYSDRQVQTIMNDLEEDGHISPKEGKNGGRGKPTVYELHFPEWLVVLHDKKHQRKKPYPKNWRVIRSDSESAVVESSQSSQLDDLFDQTFGEMQA